MESNGEDQGMRAQLMATPAAKLIEAQKRAEQFAEEREVHKACKELMQCTVLTRIIYGNGHWRLAEVLASLAHGYLILQGGDTPPTSSEEKGIILSTLVTIYYTLGMANLMQKKYPCKCYCNLKKAEKRMEELQGLDWKGAAKLKVCSKDIVVALGRASLQKTELDLASKYFEKAVDILISAEGDVAPELIHLYQEIAKIKQMKKMHEKSLSYALQPPCPPPTLQETLVNAATNCFSPEKSSLVLNYSRRGTRQHFSLLFFLLASPRGKKRTWASSGGRAHAVALALYQKFSPEVGSSALFLGKAYAATREEKHAEAAEMYFNESLAAYKVALGMDHPQTIRALQVFSKWLGQIGKRKQAYELLKESFKTQQDPCNGFNKQAAERLYIMSCICLAEEKIREAYQLLSKCVQIQIAIYGSHHKKTKKTQELLDMLNMLPAEQKLTKCLKHDKKALLICSIPDL
ncbi:tetratricopeptide repeat protein 23-like [Liasis olivaceus]